MAEKKWFRISNKITVLVILLVVVCSVSVGVFVYRHVESDLYSVKGMKAQMMASSLASALDWQSIQTILENEKEDEYYEFLKNAIIQTGARMPNISYTYVMSMRESYFYIIYAQDAQGSYIEELGFLYPLEDWNEAAIHAHTAGEPAYSQPYAVPDYGSFVSGYAPITNDAGDAIAIVGFDLPLDDIIGELMAIRSGIMVIISIFIFCSVIITILFTKRYITKPLTLLSIASNKIALGDMDILIPDTETKDEVGLLAKDFVRVRDVLNNLNNEMDELVISALKGDLSKKIETNKFEGAWGKLANELNHLLDVMSGHNVQLLDALEKAEAANQAKSNFLAAMSHEIRTPMNAIIGIAQIGLQSEGLPDEYARDLQKIYASGDCLLGIINDILDMSKIETGKLEIHPVEYDVPSLIHDTVQLNIVRLGSKPIKFLLEIDESLPTRLIGDEIRLKQVLNNLISNAIKYTEEGHIKLTVSHSAEAEEVSLHFIIEDTGQGMRLEDRDRLFMEYTRFNAEANRFIEGTGLGLNIARRLVDMMDGTIWAETEYGKGSIFMVMVKQEAVECSPIGAQLAEQLRNFSFRGNKQFTDIQINREPMPYGSVLIVDDVETNLYVAKGLLIPYGLEIDTAESGFEAMDKVESGAVYDIIFMDHMMPKMDGIETTKRIRQAGYTRPVIALTANAVVGQSEIFLKNGFTDFISKPIDIRQLNAMLNKYIRDEKPPEVVEAARQQKNAKKENANKTVDNTFLENIEGLDAEAALKNMADLPELYMDTVKLSIRLIPKTMAKMDAFMSENDIQAFTIEMHGLKSVLKNIGATIAGNNAESLESAGLENNGAYCAEYYPPFRDAVAKLVERLQQAFPVEAAAKTQASESTLLEYMLKTKEAAAGFDCNKALDTIGACAEFTYGDALDEWLQKIIFALEAFDYEEAIKTISILEDVINGSDQ